jgi:hypothetical protein
MANKKGNVKSLNTKGRLQDLSPSERLAFANKGAQASKKKREEAKTMQKIAEAMANSKPSKKIAKQIHALFPDMDIDSITNATLMLSKIFEKAVNEKDIRAFEVFRDTAGMKPVDKTSFTDPDGEGVAVPFINVTPIKAT